MLGIMLSQSKYYSDNLSANVKRGMRTKLEKGWKPNLAPIGYKNCPETKTIVPDGEHFKTVQKMFDLLLSGAHSAASVHRVVCHQWGYKTPVRKRTGGKHPAVSTVYKILSNPFYAGHIRWNGQLYAGSHIPAVSKVDFERAQKMLHGADPVKAQTKVFPYTCLLRCGACGLSVTAEHKVKPSGREYTYYHCTRIHRTPKCTQPSVEVRKLEPQIEKALDRMSLPIEVFEWFVAAIKNSAADLSHQSQKLNEERQKAVEDIEGQLEALTDLRLRNILSDEEFSRKRETLLIDLSAAKERHEQQKLQGFTLEPALIMSFFLHRAKYWFSEADALTKRKLLKILCSNPTLKDQKALLEFKKPFRQMYHLANVSRLCGTVADVGTANAQNCTMSDKQIKKLKAVLCGDTTHDLVHQIKSLAFDLDRKRWERVELEFFAGGADRRNENTNPKDRLRPGVHQHDLLAPKIL
jgi:hypothetical protein